MPNTVLVGLLGLGDASKEVPWDPSTGSLEHEGREWGKWEQRLGAAFETALVEFAPANTGEEAVRGSRNLNSEGLGKTLDFDSALVTDGPQFLFQKKRPDDVAGG
jgi:hypothetical protein